METNFAKSSVLGNEDLLRLIGEYIKGRELPFILTLKAVRDALKPLNSRSGEKWIKSEKRYFVTSVSMVEWAQSLGCEFSLDNQYNNLFTYAASNGLVDVLRWLHQNYPPNQYSTGVNKHVCYGAAQNGHIEVLEYLRSLGTIVEWNEFVCSNAAVGGHLHVLQWLRELLDPPCPWSEYTCYCAAEEGHLDMLKWLRSQEPPCPWWKQECIDEARNNNHQEVVDWLLVQPGWF